MRKNPQYIVQMPIPDIHLDLGADFQPFALSSVDSTPNKDKYHVDDIKDPTPCTLMYIKGRTSRTIEVAEAIVMPSRILHSRPVPAECEVVEVTMIREGREFEDLDYPNEEEGIKRLVDAKGTFILWLRKDIIIKTRLSPIVSPRSTEAGGTPTSNMPLRAQDPHTSATPPAQDPQEPELQDSTAKRQSSPSAQDPELQDNTELRPPSPAQDPELQDIMGKRPPSPPAQDPKLQDTTGKRSSSPPAQDTDSHPSTEQPELLPSTDRETSQPLPSTQQPVYVTAKDSLSSGFYIFGQKVQNIDKNACRQMFQALEPFINDIVVDEPSKDSATAVNFFLVVIKNINTRNH
jgi:hypothetical protein